VADGAENPELGRHLSFLNQPAPEHRHHRFEIIERLRGLRDDANPRQKWQAGGLLRTLHHLRPSPGPANDAPHLRVFPVADNDHHIALRGKVPGQFLGSLYKRAGGVHNLQA